MSNLMSNLKGKYCTLFSLGLISVIIPFGTPFTSEISSENIAMAQTNRQRKPAKPNIIQRWINSIWKRRPKRSLGARSGICPIAPGLIETYSIWRKSPLFLWRSTLENREAKLVVRERHSQKPLWVQLVNIADQKVFYNGQPLEPGKLYQWKLEGTTPSIPWITFKIMPANQRAQIQADLQALEQKSGTPNALEEIAIKKAEYFLEYAVTPQSNNHLWADALQTLYEVEKPSPSFVKKREEFVANICTSTRE